MAETNNQQESSDQVEPEGRPEPGRRPTADEMMEAIRQASNTLAGKISMQENTMRALQEKVRRQTGQDDRPVQGEPEAQDDWQSES